MREAYDKIGNENLHDLGFQARAASEELLQDGNHNVAKRSTDESAIDGHLRDTTCEVVAMLAPVLCDP